MCGICGFVHRKNLDENILENMNNTMIHRGPDDAGVYVSRLVSDDVWQIGLAQRRLSILDLSPLGHQPMESVGGECIVSYNGEIYNFKDIRTELEKCGYKFKSNCDTEVILYAYLEWGIECLNRFNGMFAISLFDRRTEELYLVRDRMGVKPLYYYKKGNEIIFASELKAIVAYPYFKAELNMNALGMFLVNLYTAGSETIYENVYKVEPGHYIKWTKNGVSDMTYWSVYDCYQNNHKFAGSYDEALDRFQELLRDSVNKRMVSDVPLGAFLSGGYDSSLISAVMQEQSNSPVKTFTIGFDMEKYDESMCAADVAKALGTDHTCEYLSMETAKNIISDIPKYYDEPMADSSQVATMLLSEITKKRVTVALSGDAGDELFGGYTRYNYARKYNKLHPIGMVADAVVRLVPSIGTLLTAKQMQSVSFAKKEYFMDFRSRAYWSQFPDIIGSIPKTNAYDKVLAIENNMTHAMMLSDTVNYLPEDILNKVDRASMRVSLETRCPLLDYRIVEFALSLPLNYKIRDGVLKAPLKDLAYRYIDKDLLDRPKRGFGVPVREWLRDDITGFARGLLEKDYIEKQGIFSWDEVKKMRHMLIDNNDLLAGGFLWNIFVFQMWYEEYIK